MTDLLDLVYDDLLQHTADESLRCLNRFWRRMVDEDEVGAAWRMSVKLDNDEEVWYDVRDATSQAPRAQAIAATVTHLCHAHELSRYLIECRGSNGVLPTWESINQAMEARDSLNQAYHLIPAVVDAEKKSLSNAGRAKGGKASAQVTRREKSLIAQAIESSKQSKQTAAVRIAHQLYAGEFPGIPRQVELSSNYIRQLKNRLSLSNRQVPQLNAINSCKWSQLV